MLRMPAVAGRFYPANPAEVITLVQQYAKIDPPNELIRAKACLAPHAGYLYSGSVAGAVYARIAIPQKIVVLGVRHYPRGEKAAIVSSGAWRTPLGDAQIDEDLAGAVKQACPLLREDRAAHSAEHSLEVQLPFLQVLAPGFSFVPIALGTARFEELAEIGEGIGRVLAGASQEILLLTTSDLNHYESDAVTRAKDHQAIARMMEMDARGLYDVCRNEEISMCGLGPAVAMLTALKLAGAREAELVKYATSADASGDFASVVGYVGMIFR
jgi:AmmeMemoRadiSam system protein B